METFLLVFAAIFPVVNPPGAALIFLGLNSRRVVPDQALARATRCRERLCHYESLANCWRACSENLWHFNSSP